MRSYFCVTCLGCQHQYLVPGDLFFGFTPRMQYEALVTCQYMMCLQCGSKKRSIFSIAWEDENGRR